MDGAKRLIFEVECTRQSAEDDEPQEWAIRVQAPNADELADAIRDTGASFCPIAFDVSEDSIDYRLPQDRIALMQGIYNFRNRFN
jgi:hypothetical protein